MKPEDCDHLSDFLNDYKYRADLTKELFDLYQQMCRSQFVSAEGFIPKGWAKWGAQNGPNQIDELMNPAFIDLNHPASLCHFLTSF